VPNRLRSGPLAVVLALAIYRTTVLRSNRVIRKWPDGGALVAFLFSLSEPVHDVVELANTSLARSKGSRPPPSGGSFADIAYHAMFFSTTQMVMLESAGLSRSPSQRRSL
jgi:hypothetical protein